MTKSQNQNADALFDQWLRMVKDEIDSQGWSVTALAKMSGVGRSHLYRIINREQVPTLSKVMDISQCLGIEIKFIYPSKAG